MSSLCLTFMRVTGWILIGFLALTTMNARAQTDFQTNCASCHLAPPSMLSQSSTFGKILAAPLISSASLRTKLLSFDGINGVSNSTMLRLGGSLLDAQLESIRLYLIQVRDAEISTPSPTFSPALTASTSTNSTFSFTIANYRRVDINYSLGSIAACPSVGDFCLVTQSISGAGCTSGVVPSTTSATAASICTVTATVKFQPGAGASGTRSATLLVDLSAADGRDPAPADLSVALSAQAVAPAAGFNITSFANFTAQVRGTPPSQSQSQSVRITNSAAATANLRLLGTPLVTGTYFSLDSGSTCDANSSLAHDDLVGCVLTVNFAPAAPGAAVGSLSISHNASGSPTNVTLTGTATQSAISLEGVITAGGVITLPFGNVNLDNTSSPPPITVKNSGTAPLVFTSFVLSNLGLGEFTRTGSCSTSTLSPLAINATCTLSFTFKPTDTVPRSVNLTINSNASNTPAVTLTGTGVALLDPVVTPLTVTAFPTTLISTPGTPSATTRVVTISNSRTNSLSYARSFSGTNAADFSVAAESCATRVVPAGGACTVTLQFTPAPGPGAGSRSGKMDLTFTGLGADRSPANQTVDLSGTASVPTPVFSLAGPINFSAVVGTPTNTTTSITNTGTAPLTLSGLSFGGTFAGEYSLAAGNACTVTTTIAVGGACALVIQFNPAAAGNRGATLAVTHNAAGSGQSVTLSGTATATPLPAIDLAGVGTLTFGSVSLGTSSPPQTFSVRNNGAAPLNLRAITVGGTAASDYLRSGSCSTASPLAVSASCTVTLTFTPTAAGTRLGTLTISSDASNVLPNPAVSFTGDGVALPEPTVTPQPVSAFPTTVLSTTSATSRVVTISNSRLNSITYARVVSGANATDFAVTAESCPTRVVPAGASCSLTLQFTPAAGPGAGNRGATLGLSFTGFAADPAPSAVNLALTGTAAAPAPTFSISSTALSVSAVVGTPSISSVIITNTGSAALSLSNLSFSGVAASDYSLAPANTCTGSTSLAPSNSCTLAIRFAPAAAGSSVAALSITHNANGSPQSVTLSGTATAAPQGRIALSALSITFADTQLGSSSAQTITVMNTGDAALTFAAFTPGGIASADFVRSGICATAAPLAIGAQCTLVITFQPTALGARSASLTVQSDASNGSATISLTGTSLPVPAPRVSLTPNAIDFGTQTTGGLYPKRTITVANVGTADLSNIAATVNGTGFANVSTAACPATLVPGAACSIDITYTPTSVATDDTGTLRVTSNASDSPQTASLHGRGTLAVVPVLVWSPAATHLDFGPTAAGTASTTQSLTLLNQGPGGVNLTVLNAVGLDSAAFSVTAGTCDIGKPLFEGETCRIDVRFAPASAGIKNASVQIASTGSFPPALALGGIGLGGPSPGLALSATALVFDLTRVGAQSLPIELTLSGNGSGVVRITGLEASGPFVLQSKTCPSAPFSLQAGSACTITVTFLPLADGHLTGSLRVTTDASPAVHELALSGEGEPKADLSNGGCSISSGNSPADPTLWILTLLAMAALLYRRRARAVERGTHTRSEQA